MKTLAPLFASTLLLGICAFGSGTSLSAEVSARNTTSATEPVLDTGNVSYANAWRVTLTKQAESDGEMVFRIIKKDDSANATRISITVVKDTSKADLAKIIEDSLASKTPAGVKVDRNVNDEISISASAGISLILDSNTVADLGIALLQE